MSSLASGWRAVRGGDSISRGIWMGNCCSRSPRVGFGRVNPEIRGSNISTSAFGLMGSHVSFSLQTFPSGLGGVLPATAIQRIGVVPVGEATSYSGIAAKHRAAAFAVMAGIMNRLKQDAPIWKRRDDCAPANAGGRAGSNPSEGCFVRQC
jgi:hypothetical protein